MLVLIVVLVPFLAVLSYMYMEYKQQKFPNHKPDGTVRRVRHVEKDYLPDPPCRLDRPQVNPPTGAVKYYLIDTDSMSDIIEIDSRAKKPYSAPAVYTSPEKPAPLKPEITDVVTRKNEYVYVKQYEPSAILAHVIEQTREEYQLPPGYVEIPLEETAVISAVILYFIQEEPKIGITKLESYIILLDKLCLDEKGRRLFSYKLTYGPFGYYIQNFRAFLDFLQDRGILSKKREYYTRRKYRMDFTSHREITAEIFPSIMLDWMNRILVAWRGAGADHTKRSMLMMLSSDALKAFTASPSLG